MRVQGDFVDGNGNPTTVSSTAFATQLTSQFGYPVHAGEQYYTAACTSTAQCVFPNGIHPPSGWAKPTVQLLKLIPGNKYNDQRDSRMAELCLQFPGA